jgi:glycosyltransferase involved in cell wall biosynthesis
MQAMNDDGEGARSLPRLIAFYLPQYHPIPENDRWWGTGFTEWRNVARGQPMFEGHHQPQLPADLGFYDLRVPEVREAQAQLAATYGISGFCYYYYWFGGDRLLERPLQEVVETGRPDFPFCICWANETWTRRWDGSEDDVLIAQPHSADSDARFIDDVLPVLADRRYITVDGKPVLLVYRAELLADPPATAEAWRGRAREAGLPGLHLCAVRSFMTTDPRPLGFDAVVEFPPQQGVFPDIRHTVRSLRPDFEGRILDYREVAHQFLTRPLPDYRMYRGVLVAWDNTARRMTRGQIIHHSSPELYQAWLAGLLRDSIRARRSDDLIFINAWNEWAEGAHLEPDLRDGHRYLEATATALASARLPQMTLISHETIEREPLISVVIPSFNHDQFVRQAIESVAAQTYRHIELVIVDDGSTDDSVRVIEHVLRDASFSRVVFKQHTNMGAPVTIDRGVTLSTGDYVAVLNSDDWYEPRRLELMLRAIDPAVDDAFGFSAVDFVATGPDAARSATTKCEPPDWYRRALWIAGLCPTAGFALLAASLTVSTSNFFFSRSLFEKLQGFHPQLALAHDWDFVLRALFYCEPSFVPVPLLSYRFHNTNAHRTLGDRHLVEGEAAVRRYVEIFGHLSPNVRSPIPANWPSYFPEFVQWVAPWFSSDSIATHIARAEPGPTFFERTRRAGQPTASEERRWTDHLRDGLCARDQVNGASIGALSQGVALKWARRSLP